MIWLLGLDHDRMIPCWAAMKSYTNQLASFHTCVRYLFTLIVFHLQKGYVNNVHDRYEHSPLPILMSTWWYHMICDVDILNDTTYITTYIFKYQYLGPRYMYDISCHMYMSHGGSRFPHAQAEGRANGSFNRNGNGLITSGDLVGWS